MAIDINKNPAPETIPTTPPDHEWEFAIVGDIYIDAAVRHDPASESAVFVTVTMRGLPEALQARAPVETHRFDAAEDGGGHGDAEVFAHDSLIQLAQAFRIRLLLKVLGVDEPARPDAPTTDIFGTPPRGEA